VALAQKRADVNAMYSSTVEEQDAVLVARAKGGDAAAVSLLYRRYVVRIYAYALQRLGDPDSAEDVTQTVFLRAVGSLANCRDEGAFAGWLFAIARNAILDVQRGRWRALDPIETAEECEDPSPTPEELALQRERRETLAEARKYCLNDQERELFDLLLSDLSDKEIAIALGKRHGAVRTAHWRLLNRLRACLGLLRRGKEEDRVAS